MSALLDEVLAAHGGLERWRAITTITAHARFGGLLRARFPGNRMTDATVRVQPSRQHSVIEGFPRAGQRAVFDAGDVRIETHDGELVESRRDARAAFAGLTGLRRNVRWDALDATYFAGYAWWNYLATPIVLTRDDVSVLEGGPWTQAGERWRRLEIRFPPDVHTHSPRQTLYVDAAGLIRRHDYTAEPVGRWARAAHYANDHQHIDGLVLPTRRRVQPRGPHGRSLRHPTLVALDIDHIEVDAHDTDLPFQQGTGSQQSV